MSLGEAVKKRRVDLGLTQVEVGNAAHIRLRTLDQIEDGNEEVPVAQFISVARTLGLRLVMQSETETRLLHGDSVGGAPPTPAAAPVHLKDALDELAAVAKRRKDKRVHIVVDYSHRDQVAQLVWGKTPGVTDSWKDLPTWNGVPVSLKEFRYDVARLERDEPSTRWPALLAETTLAPQHLSAAGAETYQQLRADGLSVDDAARLAESVETA